MPPDLCARLVQPGLCARPADNSGGIMLPPARISNTFAAPPRQVPSAPPSRVTANARCTNHNSATAMIAAESAGRP